MNDFAKVAASLSIGTFVTGALWELAAQSQQRGCIRRATRKYEMLRCEADHHPAKGGIIKGLGLELSLLTLCYVLAKDI